MTNDTKSFRDILRAEFQNRLAKDPHYRLLDFAKDLATPISRMSEIMSGRSGISTQRALHYADSLMLSPDAKSHFLKLVSNECSRTKWTRKSASPENQSDSHHGPKLFFKTYTVPQEKKQAFIEFLKSSLDQWAESNLNDHSSGGMTTVEAFEQKMN